MTERPQIEHELPCTNLSTLIRVYGELTLGVLLAVEAGEVSEGRAVELLMINREELREIRHRVLKAIAQFAASKAMPPFHLLVETTKGRS